MLGGEVTYVVQMPRSRRSFACRNALVIPLALAVCSAPLRAAQPDPIFLRFEIFGGPRLHFLTVNIAVDHTDETYSIRAEAETRSVADLFLDLRSRLEARGRVAAGALLPEAMRAETHRRGADFFTRIDYAADGSVTAEASPPPTRPATPVTPAQMRATIDQMTAYLALARALASRGSCTLVLAVFDGRRRYDLHFTDAPAEALPGFAGATQLCHMSRRRIAGFPSERAGSEVTDLGKLWFARLLPGDLMIPVRVEFESEFGAFIAKLAELRAVGVHMQFKE